MSQINTKNPLNIIVIVAALGYFVDIYDLILFGIVMKPSLSSLGIPPEMMFDTGTRLLGIQMIGMLVGGIIWGVLGDKKGRLSTLFLTILLYSLANIANGFVQSIEQYQLMRFIAGLGLAGELGVGITLVSEVMTKESRGMGTSFVSGIGIAGAVLGFLVADMFDWRVAYFVGGGLGLVLLILRISVYESGMFHKTKSEKVSRGDFLSLFTSPEKFKKYILCILVGIPVWFVISQLAVQSEKYAHDALKIQGEIIGGKAVMFHYIGASFGSLIFGYISERLKSRKKSLLICVSTLSLLLAGYFLSVGASSLVYYCMITALGVTMGGLWAVFMSNSSEQFGTNLRATVTTTAPNFVRGTTELVRLSVNSLKGTYNLWIAGVVVAVAALILSFVGIFFSEETYGKDLDFNEES